MKLFGKKNKKLAKILPLILILILVVAALIVVWATNNRQQTGGKAASQCNSDFQCPKMGANVGVRCNNHICQYYPLPTPPPTLKPVACGGVCGSNRCLTNQVCKTSVLNGVKKYLCQNDSRCSGN